MPDPFEMILSFPLVFVVLDVTLFLTLYDKHVLINGVAVEKFLPLIGKGAAYGSHSGFNKSHFFISFQKQYLLCL